MYGRHPARNKTNTYDDDHFTCPCDLVTFMMGALRSLHSTCLSFLPLSTSFIMSDQSGRLLGRLRSESSFFIFSCDSGFLAANTNPQTFCCNRSKRKSRSRACLLHTTPEHGSGCNTRVSRERDNNRQTD